MPALAEFGPWPARLVSALVAEAAHRHLPPRILVRQVLEDWLTAEAAKVDPHHHCCCCRNPNRGGLARCCLCDAWGPAIRAPEGILA